MFLPFRWRRGGRIAVVPHVCHQNQSRKTNELSREEPSTIESAFSLVFAFVLPGRMIRGTPKNTFPGYFSPNPVGRESCHNSGIFPENPGYLAGMGPAGQAMAGPINTVMHKVYFSVWYS